VTEEHNIGKKEEKKRRTLLQRTVNVFLYIGIGIFLLLVIAFAVSQTSYFRNWLRETAVNAANDALNGKVYIGRIDGTIFTSLILHDTYITMGSDTLLNASRIEVRTSPLQLFFKKIYVRKLEIGDTQIKLIRDSSGNLNISKLIPPSPEDTVSSKFPFKIIVADLKLKNLSFALRDYNINTESSYESLNLHNLSIKKLNLSLSAFADIDKNDFEAVIHSFSFEPNINGFSLKDLSGEFYVNSDSISTKNFNIKTNLSDITLNASAGNFSVFDSTKNTDFTKAILSVNLSADKFAFSDLSAFVPPTGILYGQIDANIKASGSFKLLNLDLIEVTCRSTHLQAKGTIENLDAGRDMFITTNFNNTYVNLQDIHDLLPSLQTPVYEDYGLLKFDTLVYKGKPLNFFTQADVTTKKGSFGVDGNLNLEIEPLTYDINIRTQNLDLAPVAGVNTDLTSSGSVKGQGVKPDSLNASVQFFAGGSVLNGTRMDTLKLIADAKSKNINYRLTAVADSLFASLNGKFDFNDSKLPSYELTGDIRNLDLASILKDSSAGTDLNFSIDASGKGFNPDSMDLFLSTLLYKSSVNGINIDSTRAILDIRKNDGGERVVNLISDLADITLTGDFTVMNAAGLMTTEMKILTNAVKVKLRDLLPPSREADSLVSPVQYIPQNGRNGLKTRIDYVVEFKDFRLLSLLLGGKQLELDGEVQGRVEENADSIKFTFQTNLDYLKYWGKNDVFFLSRLNLNLALFNDLGNISFSQLNADADLSIERIFMGNDITNLHFGFNLTGDSAALQFSANLGNNLRANIDSRMQFVNGAVDITFDSLSASYNKFDLRNRVPLSVVYSSNKIVFYNFQLFHNDGSISLNGELQNPGTQDLSLVIKGIRGRDISESLLGMEPQNSFQSYINFSAGIKGQYDSPVMNIKLEADSITYNKRNFGSLIANLNYENEVLSSDMRFIDSVSNLGHPKLKVTGNIPINLAFSSQGKRIIEDSPVDINVSADSFKLSTFGDMLPGVNHLKGVLTSNMHIGGTFKNLLPEGQIVLDHADFVVDKNNLQYNAGLKVSISPDRLKIDSLLIKNAPGTKNGGQMTGSGVAILKNLQIVSSDISVGGQLKVLSEESKSTSPSVYGDLVISTQGNMEFKLDSSGTYISVPIVVKEANLIFPQTATAYENTSNDFKYVYAEDTSTAINREADFQRLVDLSHKHNEAQQNKSASGSSFDYKIDVHVEKEARITFVLSKELNQNLTAILGGDFHYERVNGRTDASGELNLLNGSTLEFLKTFEADGTIRFENQLDNPYLDITATYTDYYYPAGDSVSNNEVKVAVKIIIKSFLKDLGRNLVQEQNNIAVYYGANNIENNVPDPTKTASDAVLFILAGKFTEGATQQDRNAAASTAASLAGSVVGGFLNRQFGDIIRKVELRQVGTETKFNLVGKAGDVQYSIGGSTNIFQDISQANIKLEYPITKQLLIRLERKQSVTETTSNITEMINELGLKYKFEF
jgi:hypothetical protein